MMRPAARADMTRRPSQWLLILVVWAGSPSLLNAAPEPQRERREARSEVAPFLGRFPSRLPGKMPTLLSATGAFRDIATLTPAAGVLEYRVNVPLWSDDATTTPE